MTGRGERQGGASLLEVLIALVILSIGLLGVAGMQLEGVRGAHEAQIRVQATNLAEAMMESLRADPERARRGEYDVTLEPGEEAPSGSGVAAETIADWRAMLTRALPEGGARVAVSAEGEMRVSVSWFNRLRERGGEDAVGGRERIELEGSIPDA